MYDVIIIGGGMAGLTASIYTTRRQLKTLVIAAQIGGQMSKNPEIENWPGSDKADGAELSINLLKQVQKFGAEIKSEYVKQIKISKKIFKVTTGSKTYDAKSIILAFGKSPRRLGVANEDKLIGRGVTYCVTCDGPLFKQKTVAVIGGGNSAIDAALLMSKIAKQIYLIHRRDEFRADERTLSKVKNTKNIKIILNKTVSKLIGIDRLSGIELNDGTKFDVSGLIIEIGYIVDNSFVKNLVKIDSKGQIMVDVNNQTSIPGIFAAGDLTDTPFQQLVIAAGEGATAALSAYQYIQNNY